MTRRKIEKAPSTIKSDKWERKRDATISRYAGRLILEYSGIKLLAIGGWKLFRRIRNRIAIMLKSQGRKPEDLKDPVFAEQIVKDAVSREYP